MNVKTTHKTSIRTKIILLLCISLAIVVSITLSIGYVRGYMLLRRSVGSDHVNIAKTLAASVSEMIDTQLRDIKANLDSPAWQRFVENKNLTYRPMERRSIKHYLLTMDKEWRSLPEDSPLIKEYLNNELSRSLKKLVSDKNDIIANIFVTDRFGGLVASSEVTADFYQGDEKWWQDAFDGGRGKTFVGSLVFDPQNKIWLMPIIAPIRDEGSGVIGIARAQINVNGFFAALHNFKLGQSGRVFLADKDNKVIFPTSSESKVGAFSSPEDFERIKKSKTPWLVIRGPETKKQKMFITSAAVEHPLLSAKGISWRLYLAQDAKEVFWPLGRLLAQLIVIAVFLAGVLIAVGFIFGGIFVKPIRRLQEATQHVARGELDYKIELHTEDEIEDLAQSFNQMIVNIKDKQKIIQEAQLYSQTVLSSMADALIIVNPQGMITGINKATEDISGYKEEELLGKEADRILVEEEHVFKGRGLERLLEQGAVFDLDLALASKSGEKIPVNFSASVMYSSQPPDKEAKRVIGIVGVARDMRQAKRLIADLENKTHDLTRSQQDTLSALKQLQEAKAKIEEWSRTLERRVEDRTRDLEQAHKEALRMMEEIKKGKESLEQANIKLKEMDQLKSSFVANVSHEFKNPLNIIRQSIQLVADGTAGQISPRQKEALSFGEKTVDRLIRLVSDLLDLSKIESGKVEVKRENIEITPFISEILAVYIGEFSKKQITFHQDIPADIGAIWADRDKIHQVLINLLSNAVKYTPQAGNVSLKVTGAEKEVTFEIFDSGPGIPKESQQRIFEKYERITSQREEGTGLGLSIAKDIVNLHKGRIWVESEPGRGSKFIFVLPRDLRSRL